VVIEQGGFALINHEDHIATVAAVATVGTAQRLELLAVNRSASVATIAGCNVQDDAINEARHRTLLTGLLCTDSMGRDKKSGLSRHPTGPLFIKF
jgi:hypothetical protein